MAYRHVTTGISSNLTYRHRKARTLVLNPYLEVVGRTRIMEISLEPAPSASNKLYRYHYTVSCEFPTFPDTIDNQLLPLFLPIRSYRHPALRELDQWSSLLSLGRVDAIITLFSLSRSLALAHVVYDASAILVCKDTTIILKNQEEGRFSLNFPCGLFGSLTFFSYLCRVKEITINPIYSPLKHTKL